MEFDELVRVLAGQERERAAAQAVPGAVPGGAGLAGVGVGAARAGAIDERGRNFEPPATEAEVRAAALQFVRKVSGLNKPSLANEAAFGRAVDEVAAAARTLVGSLVTNAPARDRDGEAQKARQRGRVRFASTR